MTINNVHHRKLKKMWSKSLTHSIGEFSSIRFITECTLNINNEICVRRSLQHSRFVIDIEIKIIKLVTNLYSYYWGEIDSA